MIKNVGEHASSRAFQVVSGTVVLFFCYALFSAKLCTVFVFPTKDPIRTEVYFRLLSVNEDEQVRCQIFCSFIFGEITVKWHCYLNTEKSLYFSEQCFKNFFLAEMKKKM